MSDFQYRSLKLTCFLCILNFLAFVGVAIALGGDAVSGKAVGGHYYLANKGKLTEVSAAVFTYSRWHVVSIFFTHPLAMMIGYRLKKENARRKKAWPVAVSS
ncbi:exported hypothetical protein [Bradyrhizobium sp. STM 3843]|uniref:hypothetical protein n=1 Tax=Bradyrhizobium sp. STM 3843 TaxID=551947 RepID=UPI00024040C1|nr:hypothetical protein [Bradyrhizobium sp. STM 3843]CCE12205.1 exported hypothetical protein [Bradyrhizobium sp. STM 3843]